MLVIINVYKVDFLIIFMFNENYNFFLKNKKGISSVVATALLLFVAVVLVVSFQSWFGTFSDSVFVDVEGRSNIGEELKIETLVGDMLYVKSSKDNLSISSVKIGDINCNINVNLSMGMNNISVSDCLDSVRVDVSDVVIVSDSGIVEKKIYLVDEVLSSDVDFGCQLREDKSGCENNFLIDGCGSGTVLDKGTNLCWQRNFDEGQYLLKGGAELYCDNLNLGSKSGWRIPTDEDFFTITDSSKSFPRLVGKSLIFSSVIVGELYWTTTDKIQLQSKNAIIPFGPPPNNFNTVCVTDN